MPRLVPLLAASTALLAASVAPLAPVARAQQPVTIVDDGWPTHQSNPFAQLVPRPAKLAPGDLVILTLYGLTAPGVATPFYLHVDAEGGISVPLLGVVDVKDQTTDRAAARVSKAMADANLVRDGIVTIGLLQTAAESGVTPGPIKVGDPIQVTVFDLVGTGRRLVSLAIVGEDGQVELPIAGAIKLDGLTEAQADKAVQIRYRDRQLLPNATVSVLKLAGPKVVEATEK
jgi:protein involved in polysaccharide export with SLBB domain